MRGHSAGLAVNWPTKWSGSDSIKLAHEHRESTSEDGIGHIEREWAEGTVSSILGTFNFWTKFCHSTGIARLGGGFRASATSYLCLVRALIPKIPPIKHSRHQKGHTITTCTTTHLMSEMMNLNQMVDQLVENLILH